MSNLPPNRHPFEVTAVHLRAYPYGEGDQIIQIFTREYGLLRTMAKGTRRPKSKLAGLVAPLRCTKLSLIRGRNLHIITQAESFQSLSAIQNDYDRLMVGLAMGELTAQFCQEEDAQPEFFNALLIALNILNQSDTPKTLLLWFILFFLENQGYYHQWDSCAICDIELDEQDYHFMDLSEGGVRCESCVQKNNPNQRFIKYKMVQTLQQLQISSKPEQIELDEKSLNGLLWNLQQYLQYLLGSELKTFQFLFPLGLNERS